MATSWDALFPYVQPYLPGCPEVVMRGHIRDAAIDFCERSEVWRYTFGPETTEDGERDYLIPVLSGALLENLTAFYLDGEEIPRVSDLYTSVPPSHPTGKPLSYSLLSDQMVRFYPTPDGAYAFSGTAVLKPSLSSRAMENFIFETHGRHIACGAIASLAAIPEKEWSNLDLAAVYAAKFHRYSDDAKGRDTRRTGLRVQGRKFA